MDVREAIQQEAGAETGFASVTFNQDESCFSCANEQGFLVYNTFPLSLKLTKEFKQTPERGAGIGYSQMLYRTNYIALVGGGQRPRYSLNRVVIWDDLQQKESFSLKFMSIVRKVVLSRVHLVVALEDELFIYSFHSTPKLLCPPIKTAPFGPFDFKVVTIEGKATDQAKVTSLLAYPSAKLTGQLHVADLSKLRSNQNNNQDMALTSESFLPTTIIKAHKAPIRNIRINNQGTMVATASRKGTLIRIFSTHNGILLKEFRRGLDRAEIYDMCFSHWGHDWLGSNGHIKANTNQVHSLRNIVPTSWKPKYLDSVWSMCKVHLRNPKLRNNVNDLAFNEDRCTIAWCRQNRSHTFKNGNHFNENEENKLVLVWKDSRIWEKYVILEKEAPNSNDGIKGPSPLTEWELVRESWREL
ncbi:SVP1-like protein 2 [Nakaseomyces glabratus]|nr:SVP1-like protein 2 [Nakaseomyces glabratus]